MTQTLSRPAKSAAPVQGDTSPPELLTDEQVLRFINRGYHLVETDFEPSFHVAVCAALRALKENPGNAILERVPALRRVYDHPRVRGALVSLLGPDMRMNPHRHWHVNEPGSRSQNWHQDGTNVRHHQVWTVLAMYYPHDVPAAMGPTVILPGTHFRNAPTDRMASYANIRGQVVLAVKAGTVAITHYDLWHAATLNRAPQPRSMLKFLFDRVSDPSARGGPSWNHDPATADAAFKGAVHEMVGPPLGYCSDYYKEWELRKEMWTWMLGRPEVVPPGGFKNILG